jgi:hypothetical protein
VLEYANVKIGVSIKIEHPIAPVQSIPVFVLLILSADGILQKHEKLPSEFKVNSR